MAGHLGQRPGPAILVPCVAVPVSPPCQRDQTRLLNSAAWAHPEHRTQLERGANRPPPGGPLRCQSPLNVMRWGLVPFWAKDIKVGFANINAKAEAFQRRSSLSITSTSGKRPDREAAYAVALVDRRLMALAGLCETWRSPAGERVRSFAIITTAPNELCAELHNQMPAVLKPAAWPAWLGEEPADAPQLKALLAHYPSEEMVAWPVSTLDTQVGNGWSDRPTFAGDMMAAKRAAVMPPDETRHPRHRLFRQHRLLLRLRPSPYPSRRRGCSPISPRHWCVPKAR